MIPTQNFKPYANASTPINCLTDDPAPDRSISACGIYPTTGGTLVLRPVGGASNGSEDRTVNLAAGSPFWGQFDYIASGTATNFTVYWPRTQF